MDTTTDTSHPDWTKGYKPVAERPLAFFWKGRDSDYNQEHQRSLRNLAAAHAHGPLLRPDTYMQIIKEKIDVRDERLQGPSEHVSSLSIRSAIPEAGHFCGRGSPQSGQWCATNL